MLVIGKKTFDMAKSRGLELTLEEGLTLDGSLLLCVWEADQDSEWLFSYQHTGHQLVWHGNVYAPQHIVAQIPKVIDDESELRDMLRLLEKQMYPVRGKRKRAAVALDEPAPFRQCQSTSDSQVSIVEMGQYSHLMFGMAHNGFHHL